MGDAGNADQEIVRAILAYLAAHQAAKDTLDGISDWWLLGKFSEGRRSDIERAVRELVSHDLIIETRREGLPPYYRINERKLDEIQRVLQASNGRE